MRAMIDRKSGAGRLGPALLVLFALLPAPFLAGQASRSLYFDRLMPEGPQGQPFPLVHCLIQDRLGFIWIAGPYGLARTDGENFYFFHHRDEDPSSLSDDGLFNVFEDSRGGLWATSDKGLDLLDRKTGEFLHFRHDPGNPRSLSSDRVRAVCEGRDGALWIGTVDGGLNRMDPETREFTRFLHDPMNPESPGSDAVWALCCDRDGKIWMGATESGIDCYNPESGSWRHFPYEAGDNGGPSDWHFWTLRDGRDGRIWIGTNQGGLNWLEPSSGRFHRLQLIEKSPRRWDYRILALREDRDGVLWIGTDQAGLYRLDPGSETPVRIPADPSRDGGLSHDSILSIVEDREGLIWFGTTNGLFILNKRRFRFPDVVHGSPAAEDLARGEILSLFEDREGILWIGTATGGLGRWDRNAGSWSPEGLDPAFLDLMKKVRIEAITEDDRGDLWFGTSSGLVRSRRANGAFSRYRNTEPGYSLLPSGSITALVPARPGFLWVGTRDGGLFEWDIAAEKARLFPEIAGDGLANSHINALHVDGEGRLWIATQWRGIVTFDPESLAWREYRRRPDGLRSLPSSTVTAIAEDGRGRIWAGTQAGACLLDAEKDEWIHLTDTSRLSDTPVAAVVPDGEGNVWLSSEENLFKVGIESGRMWTYGPEDGLTAGHFSVGAGFRRRGGEIVFGGSAGLDQFFPSDIADNPFPPPLVVTSVDLSSPAGRITLLGSPETLDIPRERFPIAVNLSALSFSHPERNRYRVRVPELEGRVFELGTERRYPLEDLKPGAHHFVFTAANHDGVWNPEGLDLTIRVTVPFWQSRIWRSALAVVVAASLWLWFRRRRRLLKRRLLHQIGGDLGPLYIRFDLTKREQEVLGLILQGKSNRDIETELFISAKTVKNHIYNLYQKLGVKSRLELANAVRDFAGKKRPPETG
jgi:ligand-binding sensor domain-containing protein/DNA-binding CsgD family transcriptional regulator